MDHKSHAIIKNTVNRHQDVLPEKKKPRRGPMHVVRVALFMLKLKSGSKDHHVQTGINVASKWKKLVSSIRPLHVQISTQSPAAPQYPIVANPKPPTSTYELPPADGVEELEVFTPPRSPGEKSSSASPLSSGQTSNYASALNLQELDDDRSDDESDDEDSYYDDKYGDEMIDVKAEQFIAKFYAQMKGQ